MKKLIIYLSFFLLLFSCKKEIPQPKQFQNYEQVSAYLNDVKFSIDETTDTSESEWITSAHYQSKDGKTGFLTLGMRGKPYHFQNVPVEVWEDFKNAESKGSFYHQKIKGNYLIKIK